MELHDKDIDQLFRSKLHDLESEPSSRVWEKVSKGISNPAAKKSLMPFLRIAASVVVLLGAGTWVLLKQPETIVKSGKRPQIAKQTDKHNVRQQSNLNHSAATTEVPKEPVEIALIKHPIKSHQSNIAVPNETSTRIIEVVQNQLALVQIPADVKLSQPVVPDDIIAAQPVEEKSVFKSLAALPVAQTLASAPAAKTKTKHRGIHSLGDVVNLVVAKVDKREDKLIEFTNNDEDEAEITGINLGLFRVKKEQ